MKMDKIMLQGPVYETAVGQQPLLKPVGFSLMQWPYNGASKFVCLRNGSQSSFFVMILYQ